MYFVNFYKINCCNILQYFIIYSILGWLIESIYMSFKNKKIINRGFINGPLCPIYGFGALLVIFFLKKFNNNIFLLFIYGCILSTFLEYITAIIMQYLFNKVWWDYSDEYYNYKGIICLKNSIIWGLYTLFLLSFLHKIIIKITYLCSFTFKFYICILIVLLFSFDFLCILYKKVNNEEYYAAKKYDDR